MSQKLSKKIFHISMVIVLLIIIAFIGLMMALRYDADGETDMPFYIKKLSIISTIDGQNVDNTSNKWDLNVNQNNDIYIYIEKNNSYSKTETIKNIKIDNFKIVDKPLKGNIEFYKPCNNNVSLFENKEEYKISDLYFNGDVKSNMQDLKISNQGGIVAFRCSNNNLGEYISNDEDEIEYTSLLKKININNEDIKSKVAFDMTIELNSGVSYKAIDIEIEIPFENVVEKGKTSTDITKMQNVVFKRIEN